MKRREFMKSASVAGVAAVAAASTLSKPAIAQGNRELKMVTSWPKNFPGLGTGAQRFADTVTKATDGRITVKLFAAGEIVGALECLDAVSAGTADMYHSADYYYKGKHPGFAFYTAVPYGFIAPEIDAWINFGGGQELWDELGAEFNIKNLPCGNTGVQMGGWFNKEINSLSDLKGLKMRMPGLGGDVLTAVGASALTLGGGDIFPALQAGNIDATEWVGPWNDLAFGFYKVTKYYYWPGFHEPGSTLAVGINKDVWEGFSKSDQELIAACAAAENNRMYAEYNAKNNDSLNVLTNQHGVQLRELPDDVMSAIGEASGDVVAGVRSHSDLAKRIYDSYIDFRKKAIAWNKIAEGGYTQARLLPFSYER